MSVEEKSAEKIAVVLFNLGGPLKEKDIKPFLFNFFMDKNIISLPLPFRYLLAKYISIKRSNGVSKESYNNLGGKSPLLENTLAQARALENYLHEQDTNCNVFVSMRYWYPFAEDTIKEVIKYAPDKVILLPLYPQFSTATSLSSLEDWYKAAKKYNFNVPSIDICCYPTNEDFIAVSAELVKHELDKAPQDIRLLLSAHGLPKKIIDNGDPYQDQCEKTAAAIIKKLDIPDLDWKLCYQSKVGKSDWIEPDINKELYCAGDEKKGVIIYPLAFVSEHVETLVELDVEYRYMAQNINIPYFGRVQTVGTHSQFISGLGKMILSRLEGKSCDKVCNKNFAKCYRRINKNA